MELTQEQKEVIRKIAEAFRKIIAAVKETINRVKEFFNTYIVSLEPKRRYKFLRSIGIKNYVPFFRRRGVIHCRNNC
ncbi:MAG TPA: hypothetical protein GXX75_06865 [Clostridiales bacterium]|nr:hypothetical protein [Clostridiales bacterium]